MTGTNGHADALVLALDGDLTRYRIHANGDGLTPRQEALARMHDDLRRAEAMLADARAEIARLEAERGTVAGLRRRATGLERKLARHAAAREPEALARRVLHIGEAGGVDGWRVPSDTAAGGYRLVTFSLRLESYTCDCPSFVHRGDCRHCAAVSLSIKGRATANQLQTQIQEQMR